MAEGDFVIWTMRVIMFVVCLFFGYTILTNGLESLPSFTQASFQNNLIILHNDIAPDGILDTNRFADDHMTQLFGESSVWGMEMTLEGNGDHTTMTTVTTFNSLEDLEQLLEMGMEEGIREAMGQIDALL